jgi:hypothetical protein
MTIPLRFVSECESVGGFAAEIARQANPKRLPFLSRRIHLYDTQLAHATDKHFKRYSVVVRGNNGDVFRVEYRAGNGSMNNAAKEDSNHEFFLATLGTRNASIYDPMYTVTLKIDGRCLEAILLNIEFQDATIGILAIHSRTGPLLHFEVLPGSCNVLPVEILSGDKTAKIDSTQISLLETKSVQAWANAIWSHTQPNTMCVGIFEGTFANMRPLFEQQYVAEQRRIAENAPSHDEASGALVHTTYIFSFGGHVYVVGNVTTVDTTKCQAIRLFQANDLEQLRLAVCPIIRSPSGNIYWTAMEMFSLEGTAEIVVKGETCPVPKLVKFAAEQLFPGQPSFSDHPIEGVIPSCQINGNSIVSIKKKDSKFNDLGDDKL